MRLYLRLNGIFFGIFYFSIDKTLCGCYTTNVEKHIYFSKEAYYMRRSTLFFTVLALFAILLSACGKPESESSSLPDFSESVSEQSSPKEAPQENSETVLLGSIAEINLSDIYSVKISCRNIEGIKSCRLTGSAADEYAKTLSEIRLVPFDKKKFDPITGGDIVYSVYFRGGEAEIVYDGSYTVTADLFEKEDIDGERFLPADKGYPEIPGDVFWCTLKKDSVPEVLTFAGPSCGEYSAYLEKLWEKEIVLGSAETLEQWQNGVADYSGISKIVVIDNSLGTGNVKTDLSAEECLDLLERIALLSPNVMERQENPLTGGSSFIALAFDEGGNMLWAANTGDMGFMLSFPNDEKLYRYECFRSFAPPQAETAE